MAEDRAFLSAATNGMLFLTPVARDGLREALTRPVERVGYQFENPDHMVEHMLDELEGTRGALPLLQFSALIFMAFLTTLMAPITLRWAVLRTCLPDEKAAFCQLWEEQRQ